MAVPLDLAPLDDGGAGDVALGLVLPCWTLLGLLDRAVDLTADHVRARHQFGQPLSSFQGVQFQLTDAEVERLGVEELAKHVVERRHRAARRRSTPSPCGWRPSRRPRSCSGSPTSCTAPSGSATRPRQGLSRRPALRRLPLGPSATRAALTERLGRRG